MNIIGIDPGKTGALCLLTPSFDPIVTFKRMPEDPAEIAHLLNKWRMNAVVYMEKAQVMVRPDRSQGVVGMFNYGKHNGLIEGMLIAMSIPYTLVPPQSWTKIIHEGTTGDDAKARSLVAARRLFPTVNLMRTERCKKPDEGFIDALLIAEYGRRKMG